MCVTYVVWQNQKSSQTWHSCKIFETEYAAAKRLGLVCKTGDFEFCRKMHILGACKLVVNLARPYDTTQDAILTCAQKLTWAGLIYRTEPTTRSGKQKKVIWSEVLVNSLGNPWSQSWRRKGRLRWERFAEKEDTPAVACLTTDSRYTHRSCLPADERELFTTHL